MIFISKHFSTGKLFLDLNVSKIHKILNLFFHYSLP